MENTKIQHNDMVHVWQRYIRRLLLFVILSKRLLLLLLIILISRCGFRCMFLLRILLIRLLRKFLMFRFFDYSYYGIHLRFCVFFFFVLCVVFFFSLFFTFASS